MEKNSIDLNESFMRTVLVVFVCTNLAVFAVLGFIIFNYFKELDHIKIILELITNIFIDHIEAETLR